MSASNIFHPVEGGRRYILLVCLKSKPSEKHGLSLEEAYSRLDEFLKGREFHRVAMGDFRVYLSDTRMNHDAVADIFADIDEALPWFSEDKPDLRLYESPELFGDKLPNGLKW